MNDLTADNFHYRNPKTVSLDINSPDLVANHLLPENVRQFVCNSISHNTRRAYRADLAHFQHWGGAIPTISSVVAAYVADLAATHATATIQRRIAALSRAHLALGLPDPTKVDPARSTLAGIRRMNGSAAKAAKPLLRDDLFLVMDNIGQSSRDIRDRALLMVGFAGGFRRSELVGLNMSDIQFTSQGMIINIRRSKTDQFGNGRVVGIPFGKSQYCPVVATTKWIASSKLCEGPLFRPVNRNGAIRATRLSAETVSSIVKRRVAAVGIEPKNFSGHSLRAGFATSAAQQGISSWQIRRQTGHKSDTMLARYIRSAELFEDNAGTRLY